MSNLISIETATDEEKKQAKEMGEYIVNKLRQSFTLYKVVKEYYYCFVDNKREEFDMILDSLNYRMFPLMRKGNIENLDLYFEEEVTKIINGSTTNR